MGTTPQSSKEGFQLETIGWERIRLLVSSQASGFTFSANLGALAQPELIILECRFVASPSSGGKGVKRRWCGVLLVKLLNLSSMGPIFSKRRGSNGTYVWHH